MWWLLSSSSFFLQFRTQLELNEFLIAHLEVGTNSLQDVETYMQGLMASSEICTQFDDEGYGLVLVCTVRAARPYLYGEWFYHINYDFDRDTLLLTKIAVQKVWRGL
jgi:hypothetical protein